MTRRRSSTPSLLRPLILHGYVVASTPHVHDIWPVLERLGEIADMADDIMVAFEGEGYDRLCDE